MFKYHPNTQIWLNMCTHMITSPIVCGDRFEKKVFFLITTLIKYIKVSKFTKVE